MIDFAKLNDPQFKAEMKAKREREDQEMEAKHKYIDDLTDPLRALIDSDADVLSQAERSFIRQVAQRHSMYLMPSPKQEAWLERLYRAHISPDLPATTRADHSPAPEASEPPKNPEAAAPVPAPRRFNFTRQKG